MIGDEFRSLTREIGEWNIDDLDAFSDKANSAKESRDNLNHLRVIAAGTAIVGCIAMV